jgi:hypothetical protein
VDGEPEAYRDAYREGFTQKEMLLQILHRLDAISTRLASIETLVAVHIQKPMHEGAQVDIAKITNDVETLKSSTRYFAGGMAVLLFVSPFVYQWLGSRGL